MKDYRRQIEVTISPFAPFPIVLAPITDRDYTQTPTYEVPVLRTAIKLTEIQNLSGLIVARRHV